MLQLYKALVRHYVEYYVQSRSPHCRKDEVAIENVQKRFTRYSLEWRDVVKRKYWIAWSYFHWNTRG